jgi:hypothetical protein
MTQAYKVRVYVAHKPVGYLRRVNSETSLSISLARGTRYVGDDLGRVAPHLAELGKPERDNLKAAPVVTFELLAV